MKPGPANNVITDIEPTQISFDADAFDLAIRSQGVRLVHYRAQRCPVGLTSMDDIRRPHPHHEGCSNGYIYCKVGRITGLFTGNEKNKNGEEVGFIDQATVRVTFPRQYDDSDVTIPFMVSPFDRFYVDEEAIQVPMWQLFECSETGTDRMKYPVVATPFPIVDNAGVRYLPGVDFKACDGQIEWISSRRPPPQMDIGPGYNNSATTRGNICSIWYSYHPFFYVGQVVHEIRVAQIQDELTGERGIKRMPQGVVMHREYVSLDKDQDPEEIGKGSVDGEALRKVLGNAYGGFGSR